MSDMQYRSNLILKTLYSYPSMAGLTAESGAAMVASYLEVLSIFPTEILERATFRLRSSSEKYAPSAGIIYEACDKLERRDLFDKIGRWGSEQEAALLNSRYAKVGELGNKVIRPTDLIAYSKSKNAAAI